MAIYDKAEAKINEMIKDGFIKRVDSAVYTYPAFFQAKPNGKLRFLFNAKYLNQHLARRAVIIPCGAA